MGKNVDENLVQTSKNSNQSSAPSSRRALQNSPITLFKHVKIPITMNRSLETQNVFIQKCWVTLECRSSLNFDLIGKYRQSFSQDSSGRNRALSRTLGTLHEKFVDISQFLNCRNFQVFNFFLTVISRQLQKQFKTKE